MTETLDRAMDSRIDEYIAADAYLSVHSLKAFRTVSVRWRGGYAKLLWRDLSDSRRNAIVRQTVRTLLTETDMGRASTVTVSLNGWQAPCACLCGEFVPARGPRAVRAFLDGHVAARRRS